MTRGIKKDIKIFCTVGPASLNKEVLKKLESLGVDMFRLNLSHTEIADLEPSIKKIRMYTNRPLCLDTEGAQVRIGDVERGRIFLKEGDSVDIVEGDIVGTNRSISLKPALISNQLLPGDLISIDFDSVLLLVLQKNPNAVKSRVISGGFVGCNKAVSVDRALDLPTMTDKDKRAVKIGLKNGVRHFALSFASSKAAVKEFRRFAGSASHIISKIESREGVRNLDDILKASDAILIDRGDLSREEPVEKIPFIQKMIIRKANEKRVPVYVATNLLESMVRNKNATRAEINDVVNTLLDGADGLVLAAETAIGRYPVNCVRMIRKTINQVLKFSDRDPIRNVERHDSMLLVEPHGGFLVNGMAASHDRGMIGRYKKLACDRTALLDAEQIAIGTFSPLEGFMGRRELKSVLEDCRLPGGAVWTMPITLQVTKDDIGKVKNQRAIALVSRDDGETYAALHVEDIYSYNLKKMCKDIFGTDDSRHPGVKLFSQKGEYFIGGRVELVKRLPSAHKCYEITPRQARAIFENKGWTRVVGFHTRNVIHKVHEHIQMAAMDKYHCDGVFIHPVVGPKKPGDYSGDIILKSYEMVVDNYYPRGKAVLGAFQSYSRYAGPREAVFTALCRKNFGCSHFIVGRDHTGVADYYGPKEAHELFDRLGDIGIVPIFFDEIVYCKRCGSYVDKCRHGQAGISRISGTESREILRAKRSPPEWFMRKDVSAYILDHIGRGKEVFVK